MVLMSCLVDLQPLFWGRKANYLQCSSETTLHFMGRFPGEGESEGTDFREAGFAAYEAKAWFLKLL